jgi:hypothetical protein
MNHNPNVVENIRPQESLNLLASFFSNLRGK